MPIYFLAINTLSSPGTVNSFPKQFFPKFDLGSLTFFAGFAGMLAALKNSILVASMTILISAPAGYALSRFDFRGKETFRLLILLTRAFPLPLLALPLAVMFIQTGLDDTVFGLALMHTTLAILFVVLITFSLFSGIPVELEEVAWTLGCTRVTAFTKVALPLILPGITEPPVAGFAIRRIHDRALEKTLAAAQAKALLPRIHVWHQWFYCARDPQGTGLVALLHP